MKKLVLAASALGLLAACDTQGQSAAAGAATGAAIGAAVAGNNERAGALYGAAIGTVAGVAAHGATQPPQCKYTYPDGTVIYDDCPAN